MNYNKSITKVWNLTFFVNVFNNYFNGAINNKPLNVDYTAFSFNTSSQFRFKKGWSAEISGLYRHKMLEAASVIEPMGMLSFGASKQILKNKGTLRLNVRDVFYTMYWRGSTVFDNLDMRTKFTRDSRQVALAFSYRFGKNLNNIPQRKRSNASQEEQNRVGQGGN